MFVLQLFSGHGLDSAVIVVAGHVGKDVLLSGYHVFRQCAHKDGTLC